MDIVVDADISLLIIPAVIRRGEHPGFSSPSWSPNLKRDRP